MEYFPLFYRVKHRVCLVVGGGEVAFRKSQLLLRAGAKLVIVSPQFSVDFSDWQKKWEWMYYSLLKLTALI